MCACMDRYEKVHITQKNRPHVFWIVKLVSFGVKVSIFSDFYPDLIQKYNVPFALEQIQ